MDFAFDQISKIRSDYAMILNIIIAMIVCSLLQIAIYTMNFSGNVH